MGNIVQVAGTTAVDDAGRVVGADDPYEQTKFILSKIDKALLAAGATLGDVIRTRMFVTDMAHWEAIGRAHGEFFHDIKSAAAMVQVGALPRNIGAFQFLEMWHNGNLTLKNFCAILTFAGGGNRNCSRREIVVFYNLHNYIFTRIRIYPNTRLVRPLRNGQVTLPAAFRHALRLDLAPMLQVTLEGDSLRIRAYNPVQFETGSDWLRELYQHSRLIRRESALSDEQDVNALVDRAITTLRAKADVWLSPY